jgi:hypothetical protein
MKTAQSFVRFSFLSVVRQRVPLVKKNTHRKMTGHKELTYFHRLRQHRCHFPRLRPLPSLNVINKDFKLMHYSRSGVMHVFLYFMTSVLVVVLFGSQDSWGQPQPPGSLVCTVITEKRVFQPPSAGTLEVRARCPAERIAVGGGCRCVKDSTVCPNTDDRPLTDATGWACRTVGSPTSVIRQTTYAVCCVGTVD